MEKFLFANLKKLYDIHMGHALMRELLWENIGRVKDEINFLARLDISCYI